MKVIRKIHSKKKKRETVARVPRVSKLMALAIRFDEMIQNGEVNDQAELARLGRVSRARLTQIMNLLILAPDIQEAMLHLPRVTGGDHVLIRPASGKEALIALAPSSILKRAMPAGAAFSSVAGFSG